MKGKNNEFRLAQTKFRNADTEGVANGTYVIAAGGLGMIDLDARLNRASAAAVWKYIPLQAGTHTAPFLQRGLTAGKASDVTLKLKGDLGRFPFADRSGVFRVHGQVRDAVLLFAEDWPRIEGINGEIDFDGPGMTITAKEARISVVPVSAAKAVIPDLD